MYNTSKDPHLRGLLTWAVGKHLQGKICRLPSEMGSNAIKSLIPQHFQHCNSQGWPDTSDEQDPQSHSLVQVPLLNGNGHHQAPQKEHVGVLQVFLRDLWGGRRESQERGHFLMGFIPKALAGSCIWTGNLLWFQISSSTQSSLWVCASSSPWRRQRIRIDLK